MLLTKTLAAPTGHPAYTVTLACQPEESREARKLVVHALTAWDLEHLADSATLAVSELFTNTLEHTASRHARVVVARTDLRSVRVAVLDRSAASTPTIRPTNTEDEHGRGLALVQAVSSNWGVDRLGWGKRVWCDFVCIC